MNDRSWKVQSGTIFSFIVHIVVSSYRFFGLLSFIFGVRRVLAALLSIDLSMVKFVGAKSPLRKAVTSHRTPKKRAFTLLEICICLAILGIVSGFLGWKILDAVSHHRFESSASEVASEMKRLEGLALSYQGEFGIKLFQKDEKFFYVLFTDEPLNFFPRGSPRPLKGISSLSLNHKPAKEASFVLLPSGKVEPQLLLGLHHGEKGKWLDFRKALQIKVQNSYPP